MSVYDQLRHFADGYGLIAMVVVFLVLVAWPFRPGAKKHNRKAAQSIFEDDDHGE